MHLQTSVYVGHFVVCGYVLTVFVVDRCGEQVLLLACVENGRVVGDGDLLAVH